MEKKFCTAVTCLSAESRAALHCIDCRHRSLLRDYAGHCAETVITPSMTKNLTFTLKT